jgi:hypothetical protein
MAGTGQASGGRFGRVPQQITAVDHPGPHGLQAGGQEHRLPRRAHGKSAGRSSAGDRGPRRDQVVCCEGSTGSGAVCAGSSPAGGAASTGVYAGQRTVKRSSILRFTEGSVGASWERVAHSTVGAIGRTDRATAAAAGTRARRARRGGLPSSMVGDSGSPSSSDPPPAPPRA